MKRIILMLCLVIGLALPVRADEITAPPVPDSGAAIMPEDTQSFGEGLIRMLVDALALLHPDLWEAAGVCLRIVCVAMLVSILLQFPGITDRIAQVTASVGISVLLLSSSNSLVHLGATTVTELSEYGKLLLPVLTSAVAAQGGISVSAALYTATALFNTILTNLIGKLLIPMVYLYLALSVANSALGEDMLRQMGKFIKWLTVWCLKLTLYAFTGYISLTGVIAGNADAATVKAAKITISGLVPVVGGILADASEAFLVSAGLIRNAVGIYGILAILSVCLVPFLKIGVHFLLLRATGAFCAAFSGKRIGELVQDFSAAMGLLLAMTGSVCMLLLISTVCFLKGVG